MEKGLQRMVKQLESWNYSRETRKQQRKQKGIVAQLLDMSIEEVEQKLTAEMDKTRLLVPIGVLKEGTRQNDYID